MTVFPKVAVLSLALMARASAMEANTPLEEAFLRSLDSVHASCDRDVSFMCTEPDPFMSLLSNVSPSTTMIYFVPALPSDTTGDRNMEEEDPFGTALQSMIDSSIQITGSLMKGENIENDIWENEMKAAEEVFDSLVQSFFGQLVSPVVSREDSRTNTEASASEDTPVSASEDTPVPLLGAPGHGVWRFEDAVNSIVAHGEKLLSSEETSLPQQRLARRLTALPQKVNPCLAYGCYVDHCLWKHHDVGALSAQCSAALEVAKATFHNVHLFENTPHDTPLNSERNVEEEYTTQESEAIEEEIEIMSIMMWCYFGTFLLPITLVLIFRSYFKHNHHKMMRMSSEKRELKRAILTAVYESEDIKSKVQELVDMDLGDEIPLHPNCRDAQAQPQENGCIKYLDKIFYSLPLTTLAALLVYTSITSPTAVLTVGGPSIGLLLSYIVLKSCYSCLTSFCSKREETSFELESREPLIEQSGGNDTGVCYNCDVQSFSCCGSCGCCVNCCKCKADEDSPFIVML